MIELIIPEIFPMNTSKHLRIAISHMDTMELHEKFDRVGYASLISYESQVNIGGLFSVGKANH